MLADVSIDRVKSIEINSDKPNISLGKRGEDLACEYLIMHGYEIVDRRAHARVGEIDIVAKKRGVWHFVEVKARSNTRHGKPYEAVTSWKIAHLKKAAFIYLMREGVSLSSPLSMDVISIEIGQRGKPSIVHYTSIAV